MRGAGMCQARRSPVAPGEDAMRRLVLVLIASLASLAARAADLPHYDKFVHLGVTSCAGSTCHGAVEPFKNSNVEQNEYITWSRKDPHAKAYKVLLEERSQRMARNLGLPDAHTADICLDCHADNVDAARRGRQFQVADGVGCEACHGGSSGWLGIHISGASHADNLKAGLYPTEDPVARAELCLSCHYGNNQKFVSHRLMGAGHPRIGFELDTFTATQPAHFVIDKDYVQRKFQPNGVQIWAIGQAMSLARTMESMLDAKLNPNSVFPELVFFDCHACHHPMSDLRWSARPSVGLGPGVIKFNDSNAIMLRLIAARVAPEAAKALGEKMRAMHFAVGESRDETRRLAGEIRVVARQLVEAFGRHEFGRADMQALLAGVIADGEAQEFIDFASAEQATMAISSIVNAMKAAGHVSDDVFVAMNAALQKLNAAVEKDEAYRAPAYRLALKDFEKTAPKP
jgi:hypothetical protein